jgi:hypothetical protein
MDSAYTRVLPNYLKPVREQDIVGLFRGVVHGVLVDYEARVVRTVLGDALGRGIATRPRYSRYEYDCDLAREDKDSIRKRFDVPEADKPFCPSSLSLALAGEAKENWDPEKPSQGERLFGLYVDDWNVARRCCRLRQSDDGEPQQGTSSAMLLALVMGDVLQNGNWLVKIRPDLASIGMPIAGWMIEYREHLYDAWGREGFEPIFTADYLKNVIAGMWDLSSKVFGESRFTYEDLASCIGEHDVTRVRRAVRRIAIMVNGVWRMERPPDPRPPCALWAGETHWQWAVAGDRRGKCCCFAAPDAVKKVVERGGDGNDND